MNTTLRHWLILMALALILFPDAPTGAQQVYQWIDKDGVRRFSNKPPTSAEVQSVQKSDEIPHDAEADRQRMAREEDAFEEWLAKEREKQALAEVAEKKAQAEAERRAETRRQQELEEKVRELEQDLEKEKRRSRYDYWFFPTRPPIVSPYVAHGSNRPGHFPGYRPGHSGKDRPSHGKPPGEEPVHLPAEEQRLRGNKIR